MVNGVDETMGCHRTEAAELRWESSKVRPTPDSQVIVACVILFQKYVLIIPVATRRFWQTPVSLTITNSATAR